LDDLVEIRVRAALLVLGGAPADSPLRINESHERSKTGHQATFKAFYDRAVTDDADIAAAIARNVIAPWAV
jgi:hypothetical protein